MNRAEAGAVVAYLARTYPSVIVDAIAEDWPVELDSIDFARGMTAARMLACANVPQRTRVTLAALLYFIAATHPTHSTSHPVGMLRVTESPRLGEGPGDERPSSS